MTIEEFLTDYGSTTQHFKSWSNDYRLEVLEHGLNGNKFQRIVVIFVDKIPVMLGLSETEITNPLFMDILQNAGLVPIGVRLFDPSAGISRTQAQVGQLNTANIDNEIVLGYLANSGVTGSIHYRQSVFIINKQSMLLKEYIMPGLIELLAIKT